MTQEHEFAVTWTFRDPMTTVEYVRGWKGPLPANRLKAARDAGVLVVEEPSVEAVEPKPKRIRKKPQ